MFALKKALCRKSEYLDSRHPEADNYETKALITDNYVDSLLLKTCSSPLPWVQGTVLKIMQKINFFMPTSVVAANYKAGYFYRL